MGMDGSGFYLKPRILALGHMHLMEVPISVSAQPVLDRLAREIGETCTLAVLDREEIVFVAHSAKTALVSVHFAVGSRLPAYCTANGRVLLGALPQPELDEYLSTVRLGRLTEHTVTGKKQLREQLDQVRHDGYALVDQEFDLKIRSIAVPVRQGGRIIASMSIAVPVERVGVRQLRGEYLTALRDAAAEFA
jgi:IclR family transcriptional regulator, pca regulon regulatory protein